MRPALLATAAFFAALPALAQPSLPRPPERLPAARVAESAGQRLSVTIYNNDLALMEDVRTLELPAGRSRVEFRDVSAAIRPETVSLAGRGLSVVEQNFDYDLLTPAKLMEKAVGDEVIVVRTNPGNGQEVRETATVLAANDGVVLRIGDRIEVLRDDGVPTRVIFDEVPDNLRARPTLSVTLDAEGAPQREVTLTYLSSGLGWAADYVALFDERAGKLDLQGWITLRNNTGTPFTNAEVQLVAGDVASSEPQPYRGGYPMPGRPGMTSAGTESGEDGEVLGDVYLYNLPERTTVANAQTKQVGFLDASGVSARKVYEYRATGWDTLEQPANADVVVQFANARAGGLGAQLPAGTMRVYIRDGQGDPKFIGEQAISHTPQGSQLSVKTGDAFDVTVQPTRLELTEVPGSRGLSRYTRTRIKMRYLVRNARGQPVTVQIRQPGLWRDGKVVTESLPSRRADSSTLVYDVPVPANGETTLTFIVDNGW